MVLPWAAAVLILFGLWQVARSEPAGWWYVAAGGALLLSIVTAWSIAPRVPSGDEPHYLVIAQSLWLDGDLKIQNNHERRDYASYVQSTIPPDYVQRGRDGEIYSIHAPGTSVIVLPAFLAFGYRGASATVMAASAMTAALVWLIGWRTTDSASAAWFGLSALVTTPTFLLQSATVFPDGLGLAATAVGVYLWVRLHAPGPPPTPLTVLGASTVLAMMPWLHTRFAIIALCLGTAMLPRLRGRHLAAFLAVPAVMAAAWFGYFLLIYGTPNPIAPYGGLATLTSLRFVPGGMLGVLFDQQFGLIAYSPVLLSVTMGAWAARGDRLERRLVWTCVAIAVTYLIVATRFWMWWVGVPAPPARLATVALPLMAPALAVAFARSSPRARAGWLTLLAISVAITAVTVLVDRGALAWNPRDARARWLLWIAPMVDLPRAWPSFFWRLDPFDLSTEWPFAAHTALYVGIPAMLLSVMTTIAHRREWALARWQVGLAWWTIGSLVAIATIGWWLTGTSGIDVPTVGGDVPTPAEPA